jgi:hypothetical protein
MRLAEVPPHVISQIEQRVLRSSLHSMVVGIAAE